MLVDRALFRVELWLRPAYGKSERLSVDHYLAKDETTLRAYLKERYGFSDSRSHDYDSEKEFEVTRLFVQEI